MTAQARRSGDAAGVGVQADGERPAPAGHPVRPALANARTWVVKIGSALLTGNGSGIQTGLLGDWCRQLAALAEDCRVVLVSSGAVAEGCRRLGFAERPAAIHELQAAAAVGQSGLAHAYERAFKRHGRHTALVLLTHDDLANRERYLNARTTLATLIDLGIVPIVNENDSVATEEIKLGDNDTLAARVASLLAADVLVLLTDQDGLFEADPRLQPGAPMVEAAHATDPRLDAMAGHGAGHLGRGGMVTKLAAARAAAQSGTHTVIAGGSASEVLLRLRRGERIGTLLTADLAPLDARKRWIAGQLRAKGEIRVDAGAAKAIAHRGVSILPAGVVAASGGFRRGDLVRVLDEGDTEIAKGLANYDMAETRRLVGRKSSEIEAVLGYVDDEEIVHRDNLVVGPSRP